MLKNLAKRLLIFSYLYYFCFIKYNTLAKSSNEYKDKIREFIDFIGFSEVKAFKNILKEPEKPFTIFLAIILVFTLFSTLGLKPFYCICSLFLSLISMIYYNPWVYENESKKGQDLFWLPNLPFLCLNVLSVGIIMLIFKEDDKDEKKDKVKEKMD